MLLLKSTSASPPLPSPHAQQHHPINIINTAPSPCIIHHILHQIHLSHVVHLVQCILCNLPLAFAVPSVSLHFTHSPVHPRLPFHAGSFDAPTLQESPRASAVSSASQDASMIVVSETHRFHIFASPKLITRNNDHRPPCQPHGTIASLSCSSQKPCGNEFDDTSTRGFSVQACDQVTSECLRVRLFNPCTS